MKPLLLTLALLCGCSSEVSTQTPQSPVRSAYRCQSLGEFEEDVCMISIFRLAADPAPYEGKLVGINGYMQIIDGDYYLFASKEFYEAKDFSNALVCVKKPSNACDQLAGYVAKNINVVARFSDRVAIGEWVVRPIGSIDPKRVIEGG